MRQNEMHGARCQERPRDAAENILANPRVSVSAHHEVGGLRLLGLGNQCGRDEIGLDIFDHEIGVNVVSREIFEDSRRRDPRRRR